MSFRHALPLFLFFLCAATVGVIVVPHQAAAATAAELQAQIDAHNLDIANLQADIAKYQQQLETVGKKKNTLQSTISGLTISEKQLQSKIAVNENKIASANLRIQELSLSIGDKEALMNSDKVAISKTLRSINESEAIPFVAQLIGANSFTEAWKSVDEAGQLNRALSSHITDLKTVRTVLSNNRDAIATQKTLLISLADDLATQKRSVEASKSAQQTLLSQTQNQESKYQQLLLDKKTAEQAFQDQLVALQSQLNLIVHPGSLPKVGTGILSWPFSASLMRGCAQQSDYFGNPYCITQYFGNTPFATANAQVYNGHGHNGIDIGVPIGTPVLAALSGTILDTGNTDAVYDSSGNQCYSFGKWVMIDHGNGLNTMYAHLSEIDVSRGESVATGQLLGLSGMTGYATGPHLHFGVYATEGTKIMTLRQFRGVTWGCADAKMPVATLDAYLNPLSYL